MSIYFADNTWMQYNDLVSDVTRFSAETSAVPPSQVHIMMWEKQTENQRYIPPRKSAQFMELTKELTQGMALVDPPSVRREQAPVQLDGTTLSVQNKEKFSHLRPSRSLSKAGRLEQMRTRFQMDTAKLVGASEQPAAATIPHTTNVTTVNLQPLSSAVVSKPQVYAPCNVTKDSFQSRKLEKTESKWLTKPTGKSYLEAYKPYLKSSTPQSNANRNGRTFQGYVPKSQKQQLKDSDQSGPSVMKTTTAPIVPTSTPQEISATDSLEKKPLVKLKKVKAKSVSFFDNEGFRIPSNPLRSQSGTRPIPAQGSHRSIPTNLAHNLSNQGTVESPVGLKHRMSPDRQKNKARQGKLRLDIIDPMSASGSTRMAPLSSPTSLSHMADMDSQSQPLDLSPVRRNSTSSPASPLPSSLIDQLCFDLPNELAEMPSASVHSDTSNSNFGLTCDEMSVMESLTNMLVPDGYASPKKEQKSCRTPQSGINLSSFFDEF